MSNRKPFEPISKINPLDFPTYNADGTLWEGGEYPNDKPKFTFTYEDHTAREKPPYPKHTIICYGKETMLNVMEHFDGYSYTCLLYTSPSPRDTAISRMPSSA